MGPIGREATACIGSERPRGSVRCRDFGSARAVLWRPQLDAAFNRWRARRGMPGGIVVRDRQRRPRAARNYSAATLPSGLIPRDIGRNIFSDGPCLPRDAEQEPGAHVLKTEVADEENVDGPWTDPRVDERRASALASRARLARPRERGRRGQAFVPAKVGKGAVNRTAASAQTLAKTARQNWSQSAAPRSTRWQPFSERRKTQLNRRTGGLT